MLDRYVLDVRAIEPRREFAACKVVRDGSDEMIEYDRSLLTEREVRDVREVRPVGQCFSYRVVLGRTVEVSRRGEEGHGKKARQCIEYHMRQMRGHVLPYRRNNMYDPAVPFPAVHPRADRAARLELRYKRLETALGVR